MTVLALAIAAPAQATFSGAIAGVSAHSHQQRPGTPGGVSLNVSLETSWTPASPPTSFTDRVIVHLDTDFDVEPDTLPTCDPMAISTATTAAAIAACPGAVIGSGVASFDGVAGPATGVVTVFNGTPSGGDRVLLHVRAGPPLDATQVVVGEVDPSSAPGYGKQLDFDFQGMLGGTIVFTELEFTLNLTPRPLGGHLVEARCSDDPVPTWNYRLDLFLADSSSPGTENLTVESNIGQVCEVMRLLTVTVSGSGTVLGPDINCPGDCSGLVSSDTPVALLATPAAGSAFSGWTGACSGASPVCNLSLSANSTVEAAFAALPNQRAKKKRKRKRKKNRK